MNHTGEGEDGDEDATTRDANVVARLSTPQLSGENLQMIEAKAELSRVVERYGFSVTSLAWEWLVVDHNMETGEMLVDPARSLEQPFAFTPPFQAHSTSHSHFPFLRLPTPMPPSSPVPVPLPLTLSQSEANILVEETLQQCIEFQFIVTPDDDDDDNNNDKR